MMHKKSHHPAMTTGQIQNSFWIANAGGCNRLVYAFDRGEANLEVMIAVALVHAIVRRDAALDSRQQLYFIGLQRGILKQFLFLLLRTGWTGSQAATNVPQTPANFLERSRNCAHRARGPHFRY